MQHGGAYHLPALIVELAEKYRLSAEVTRDILESTLSEILTLEMGHQVAVTVAGEVVHALHYGDGPNPNVIHRDLTGSFQGDMKGMRAALENAFAAKAARMHFDALNPLRNKTVLGEVAKVEERSLWVEVSEPAYSAAKVTALCGKRDIPPREVKRISLGDRLWFYVKSVRMRRYLDTTRVEVELSRTSIKLPEQLLCAAGAGDVRCSRRIAGWRCEVTSPKPIQKKVLQDVGKLLGGEFIHVEVVGP